MPVRGVGGTAVLTVKDREDLRLSRNGSYVLQSSYESTFSFTLVNSGKRHAFARTVVLYYGESGNPEQIPVDIRPAPGVVIGRDESTIYIAGCANARAAKRFRATALRAWLSDLLMEQLFLKGK
ncbi:unnamed protein product [Strongylus vulgaris]|uniref:Uncharacterized protein n=1 Tax=Strongylus vulgaris TaxID=40348 RepID=A0A3P7JCZ0_STRVU|nr:unnamed protein product [Strongylus vulgaris]